MAELDPVTQEFIADTAPYVAGLEEAIAATDRFRESVDAALISVEALHAAIDDLPAEKTIHINFDTSGMPAAAAAAGARTGAGDTGGLAAEAAAAHEAGNAAAEAAAQFREMEQALDGTDISAERLAREEANFPGTMASLRDMLEGDAEAARAAGDATAYQGRKASEAGIANALYGAEVMKGHFANAAAAGSARAAGAAAAASGNAAGNAAWGWRVLTNDVTLWAGALGNTALIGSVKLWHLALDGVFEAAVALASALAALSIGLYAMSGAAQDIYTHLKSVSAVNSALGSSIPPLTGKFDALKQAMASQTVEAYGGALNLLGSNMTHINQITREVVTGLDDWIAKLDIWKRSQASMGGILDHGVGFLHQFEQVVNNVGQAISNLIRSDPGTAHYLMDIVVGFSKLLQVVTSIPQPILMAALALHSFQLWGGLAFSKVVQLGAALQGFGRGIVAGGAGLAQFVSQLGFLGPKAEAAVIPMNDLRTAEAGAALGSNSLAFNLAKLATNPFTWVAVAAAAIGYLAWQANQASAAAKAFTESIDKGVGSAAPSQAIMLIANDMGALNAKMTQTTRGATQMADAMGKNRYTINAVNATMKQSANDVSMYRNEINKLATGPLKNLFAETGNLIKQGYSYNQALALMDLAGVQTGNSFQLMQQKVANLITGYQNMSVQGGILSNSVNAISFASEQQSSKIQQLTQAWTSFIGLVTGGESSFITAEQGIYGMAAAASGAATNLTVSNGKTSLQTKATASLGAAATSTAVSLGGLSQGSLQLASTYQTAITNGSNLLNSLTMQASAAGLGAQGYNLLARAGKDYLQQLLPMAKGNQLATSELYALAQQAGYQGVNSFQALSQWIGHTSNAGQDLQGIVTKLTAASAGLTNDMNNLANAISGNLNNAMAGAIAQANGGQKAFNNFANAAVHAHGTTDGMTSSATSLARELIATTGDANSAHRMFDTFSISLGLSKRQADALWTAATKAAGGVRNTGNSAHTAGNQANTAAGQVRGLGSAIDGLHSKTITITTAFNTVGSNLFPGAANVNKLFVGATGGRVPGYGGGDVHPAMLEGGEAVVPKHLTPAVAPFLKSHGVPGFEGGGFISSSGGAGSFGGGGNQPVHVHLMLNGNEIASALVPNLTSANGKYAVRNSGKATGVWKPI